MQDTINHKRQKAQASEKSQQVVQISNVSLGNHSQWTQFESLKYAIFIEIFEKKYQRCGRRPNLFKLMSKLLKTRTITQCRAYADKIEKQNLSCKEFINQTKAKVGIDDYIIQFKKCKNQLLEIMAENPQSYIKLTSEVAQLNLLRNDIQKNEQSKQKVDKNTKVDKKNQSVFIDNQVKKQQNQLELKWHQPLDFVMSYPFNRNFMVNLDAKALTKRDSSKNQSQAKQYNYSNGNPYFNRALIQRYSPQNIGNMCSIQESRYPNNAYYLHQVSQESAQYKTNVRKRIQEMKQMLKMKYTKDPYILSLKRQKMVQQCNYHWNQWLKLSLQLAQLQSQAKSEHIVKQ